MSDSYLKFVNKPFGGKLSALLGLPQPQLLERYNGEENTKEARLEGDVLIAKAAEKTILPSIIGQISAISSAVHYHSSACQADQKEWDSRTEIKAIVFDATGLSDSSDSTAMYQFFNESVKSIQRNGRVVVLARPSNSCVNAEHSIAQRALEGFTRSLAKELRNAITVQLVMLETGAEQQLESTLRFLLSPRSAYVSGQVIQLSESRQAVPSNIDWRAPLSGKKILVTGASQGIGAAISEVLARDGAHLVCLDIPQASEALKAISKRLNADSIELNLNQEDATERLVDQALKHGGWDVVVHNAGITRDKTIAKMSPEQWASVVNINLSVQQKLNRALLACGGIRPGGRVICVSSISGIAGNRGQSNYAYSKAGVIGMVESMAPIFAEKDITINAVAPGFIETKMTAAIPFAVREAGRRLNSLSQGGLPVDVAETIAWFASPASASLNANVVRVCGQSILGA